MKQHFHRNASGDQEGLPVLAAQRNDSCNCHQGSLSSRRRGCRAEAGGAPCIPEAAVTQIMVSDLKQQPDTDGHFKDGDF